MTSVVNLAKKKNDFVRKLPQFGSHSDAPTTHDSSASAFIVQENIENVRASSLFSVCWRQRARENCAVRSPEWSQLEWKITGSLAELQLRVEDTAKRASAPALWMRANCTHTRLLHERCGFALWSEREGERL